MKTVKSIFAAVVLLFSTSITLATEPVNDPSLFIEASQEISKLLESPAFEVREDFSASVSLIVNNDGELVVLDVDTDSSQVESYVKSRLNYHKINAQLTKGLEYEVPLKFRAGS